MPLLFKRFSIPVLVIIASKWVWYEYHVESECFKFKYTGTTTSYDDVALLNDFEIIRLIIEKIKNMNV